MLEVTRTCSRFLQITDRFRGIYIIYLELIKENWKVSTCSQLDFEILESRPSLSKISMDTIDILPLAPLPHRSVLSLEENLSITTIHCNLPLWLMARKCRSKSFWLSIKGFWLLIVQNLRSKTLVDYQIICSGYFSKEVQWPSHNKWLIWTSFLGV